MLQGEMRLYLKIGVLASILLLSVGAAQAATVYVNAANETGMEDGTFANPFDTIQEGIDVAYAGDTVLVKPGVYHGEITLKDSVVVRSENGPKVTIIDGDGAPNVIYMPYTLECNTSLEGFTVKNGGNLIFVTNRVNFWSSSVINATNCIFTAWQGFAIRTEPSGQAYVKQSVFYNPGVTNDVAAFNFKAVYYGIWNYGSSFTNVTIDSVATGFFMYQTGVYLKNTAVSNIDFLGITYSYGNIYADHVNFYNIKATGNSGGVYDTGQVHLYQQFCQSVDPLFVDAPARDYRLGSRSLLINAGINVGLPYNGLAPDIGAYETDATISQMVGVLSESYQQVLMERYKNAGEQRRDALQNKFQALLSQINAIRDNMTRDEKLAAWQDVLDKLLNDIWAKGDGFFGGNPKNDWITTQEEQTRLHEKVKELETSIRAEIARL